MSSGAQSIKVGGRQLSFSNLDKPLFPTGFTKGDLIDYYGRVAGAMLPFLKGRAVTLKRYPNGTDAPFFFEKRCPPHKPDWVETADVIGSTGTVNHCVIDDVPTLLWAANLAAIEFHVPMAVAKHATRPTAVVFDLDPGEPATLLDCLRLGINLKKLLAKFNLECLAKTSGNKGLHVYVPLNTTATFDQTKTFARVIAEKMVLSDPDRITATMSKSLRHGKVFIDWSQNDTHKTTVCAFSLRAKPTPSVSTPVSWTEIAGAVKAGSAEKLSFDAAEVIQRLERGKESFSLLTSMKQKLPTLKH